MKLIYGVIGFVGLGTLVLWLSGIFPTPSQSRQATPLATHVSLPSTIRALGYLEPVSEIRRLVFKVDGIIGSCQVAIGQNVKKGEILMTLRNQSEKAAQNLAEKDLALAMAERDQLIAGTPYHQIAAAEDKVQLFREHVRHAQKQLDRTKALVVKKTSPEEEMDRAETELIRSKKGLQQAESELAHLKNVVRPVDHSFANAKVEKAKSQLNVVKERLEETFLTAPFDGTVLEILRREGESAQLLNREPVIVFADLTRLRARTEIDERFVSKLKVGQQATVFGRGLGDKTWSGQITLIKGVMGPKTVFSHDSSERKDLDIVQVLIDLPEECKAPVGLQVEVRVEVK